MPLMLRATAAVDINIIYGEMMHFIYVSGVYGVLYMYIESDLVNINGCHAHTC